MHIAVACVHVSWLVTSFLSLHSRRAVHKSPMQPSAVLSKYLHSCASGRPWPLSFFLSFLLWEVARKLAHAVRVHPHDRRGRLLRNASALGYKRKEGSQRTHASASAPTYLRLRALTGNGSLVAGEKEMKTNEQTGKYGARY